MNDLVKIFAGKMYTKIFFEATMSCTYRALHYKIITRIHATNILLYRMGVTDSSRCVRCSNARDTLEHKFWHCRIAHRFWDDILAWFQAKGITDGDQFTESSVILGTSKDALINHVIICAKDNYTTGSRIATASSFRPPKKGQGDRALYSHN